MISSHFLKKYMDNYTKMATKRKILSYTIPKYDPLATNIRDYSKKIKEIRPGPSTIKSTSRIGDDIKLNVFSMLYKQQMVLTYNKDEFWKESVVNLTSAIEHKYGDEFPLKARLRYTFQDPLGNTGDRKITTKFTETIYDCKSLKKELDKKVVNIQTLLNNKISHSATLWNVNAYMDVIPEAYYNEDDDCITYLVN